MAIDHTRKTKYTWGLNKLDNALSKPDIMELITVYGSAGTGKTEFTYFAARANADLWVKVLYLSLEMPAEQLATRYALKKAWIKSYIEYQDKKYTQHQGELIDQYYKEFIEYKNIAVVWDDRQYTIHDLVWEWWLLQEYYDFWYRLFIIDNLGKILTSKNEWESQGEITSALQSRKNKMQVCIMLIHHTGKSKKWTEPDMRWSQKIIDNSTKVIKLARDSDPDAIPADKAKLMIRQEKNSMRWEYVETECYFDRWVYVEEFVGDLYKNKRLQKAIEEDEIRDG